VFGEYADAVDKVKPSINVTSFVGHGTLRSCVMGADDRAPTEDELARMRALLAKSMDEGAIGLAFERVIDCADDEHRRDRCLCRSSRDHLS